MSQVLLYCRTKAKEPLAEQTVTQLAEQLYLAGHQVDITHSLNIPRLILNTYQTVHLVIESHPLTINETFHLALCNALQKNTLVSLLNSNLHLPQASWLRACRPDAISVSQTNHLKYYRSVSGAKFIMPAWPRCETATRPSAFKHKAFIVPIVEKMDEVFDYPTDEVIYFDGHVLLKDYSALQLRKKWTDLVNRKKISAQAHLLLSDAKVNEVLNDGQLTVILSQSNRTHTNFTEWLGRTLNKKHLIVLNENQSTGFSGHWTSGQNCLVVTPTETFQNIQFQLENKNFQCSACRPIELYDGIVNELSRLYSKLSQQKTTLLTSRSAKL